MHKLNFLIAVIFCLSFSPQGQAKAVSFSIDLIHRDSPLSPSYNHSKTEAELLNDAFLRSMSRTKHFKSFLADQKTIVSDVIPSGAEYLMTISVGTPPVQQYVVADTGSDLIWVQCMPCEQCYEQDTAIFDPSKSSTYKELPCSSQPCQALSRNGGCGSSNECTYQYSYVDKSFTNGDLSTETLTFDSSDGRVAVFPSSSFGCGHNNAGKFNSKTSGIVGLGQGTLSLVSQLAAEIENKFSYCLVPRSSATTSKLNFGREAIISGNEIISTPLISGSSQTFYYLTLEGISVGDRNVQSGQNQGNIIIDSGTTFTMLESSLYNSLEATLQEAIGIEPVQATSTSLKLCYRQGSANFPDLVFHFTGADLRLSPENTFISDNDLSCLAIIPNDGLSIFGNVAQVNYHIEYDLDAKKVSFAPADCTKLQ